jgi:hypothetical protein
MKFTRAEADDRPTLDEAITRVVAIAALGGIALIHILQLPEALDAEGYVGGLFIAAIVACIVLAAGMTRMSDVRLLEAAGGLAALLLLGYIISRTVGLPGFTQDMGNWSEPLGLISMVVEGLLVCVAAAGLTLTAGSSERSVHMRQMQGPQPGASAG